MIKYITPNIEKYESVDNFLAHENATRSKFESQQELSVIDILNESFLCIVGEPGVGKSRLMEEVLLSISTKEFVAVCNASKFNKDDFVSEYKYCIIDALDEVDENKFFDKLVEIKNFKKAHPSTHVLFSCRSHYVSTYRQYFSSCEGLHFLEIQKFKKEDVEKVISNLSQNTQGCIAKSPKLFELLRTPRYLDFLMALEERRIECKSIGDLFEYIIDQIIEQALKNNESVNYKNTNILVRRVLEKIALIIEIGRKDSITKDDLYTILDGLTGNMSQMLIANVDLFYFQNRILIYEGDKLKFGNTELQEYLAAKELCRQSDIESLIYDFAVQKELRHIYPNWFDIIPHISYLSDANTFINTIKLLASYERNLDSEVFAGLTKYVEPNSLQKSQKEELFKLLFENFLHNSVYISWRGEVLRLLAECYSDKCNDLLLIPYEDLNKIHLYNICSILEVLCKEMQSLDVLVKEYWINAASELVKSIDTDKQRNAICIFDALQDKLDLIELSSSYNSWEQDTRNKYLEVTGYGKIIDEKIIKIWLEECYKQNPYAINAVLHQTDAECIAKIYHRIVKDNKVQEFLNYNGTLAVFYELYLPKQLDIVWKYDVNARLVLTKIISLMSQHYHHSKAIVFDRIIKTILLNKETANVFVKQFKHIWNVEHILSELDTTLIDAELIKATENAFSSIEADEWQKDNCIITLVNKIRNDESKKDSVSNYLLKYAETFRRWDNNAAKDARNNDWQNELDQIYKLLNDNKSDLEGVWAAYDLCANIAYLESRDISSFVDVIEKYINTIDLEAVEITKTSNNSFQYSEELVYLPVFVKTLFKLNLHAKLANHRMLIAKTLPVVFCTYEFNDDEIKDAYKHVLGDLTTKDKEELVLWWKGRTDDYMNYNHKNIISCITEYGIDLLSYKLEEYIEDYIAHQDGNGMLAASDSLEIIASNEYCHWTLDNYKSVFERLVDEDVDSLKMMCNGIMIEKFRDQPSILWRIDYLKNHKVKSLDFQSGYARAISSAESEMISPNPVLFRCFMSIAGNEYLNNQMFDLFSFTLTFVDDYNYRVYAEYLLKQTCLYFAIIGECFHFTRLRSEVAKCDSIKSIYMINSILSKSEVLLMQNKTEKISSAVKTYNECLEKKYLQIKNEYDLRNFFQIVKQEVQKAIQDEGIYSVIRQENLNEDFIQRELKITIINTCCKLGLTEVKIDREVALQDNKRTDILMTYGMCRPIMIELKLLHNKEIQIDSERKRYKKKFVQYARATNACLSVFWIFDIKTPKGKREKAETLKVEYSDLNDTIVVLSDCKCSSEQETGISKKNKLKVGAQKRK